MKKHSLSVLFFYSNILLLFCVNIKLYSQNLVDSTSFYYQLSTDKTKNFDQQLYYLNKSIDFSKNTSNTEVLLKGLDRKSYLLYKKGDYKNAISIAKELLKKGLLIKDTNTILLSYQKLADYNRLNDSMFVAYNYYQDHKTLRLKYHDSLAAVRDLRFIASIQYRLGLLYESEATAVEALSIIDKLGINNKTLEPKVGLYNHLGIIYKEQGNYERALEFYKKLLPLTKDDFRRNIIQNNIANVYKDQNKLELAFNEFKKVYQNSIKLQDSSQIGRVLNNLAFVEAKLNYPNALGDMETALMFRKKNNDPQEVFNSYITFCEYYKDRSNSDKLSFYAKKAYQLSISNKNPHERLEALSYLVDVDGNKTIIEYRNLLDSLSKVNQNNENKFAFTKYNYFKKEKEAHDIELKFKDSQITVEKEKFNRYLFQSIAIFGLLVTILLYFLIQAKHKKDKIQQVYNTEVRISKKVHDEVANDVYNIMTKLEQNKKVANDVLDDLEGIYNKTRDISKENNIIDVHEDYGSHLKDLLLSYRSDKVNVITKDIDKINWNHFHETKKFALYRVLQELMTNMRKHSKATLVVVKFNQNNRKISVSYNDNGIGCNLVKNNGLRNTENRMESARGTITFDSQKDKGFSAHIIV